MTKRLPVASWAGLAAIGMLIGGAMGPVIAFAIAGGDSFGSAAGALSDPVIWRALRFTLWQAMLSTVLSIAFAIPVAIVLFDAKPFWGRGLLLKLFGLPLALPQIVAVLAIIAVYGQSGWLNGAAQTLEFSLPSIFGLSGILLAHVFFNMPLAVRIILAALDKMPPQYRLLCAQLGFGFKARLFLIYWPLGRHAIAQASTLIFMLCATSFTVVLTLGGGPRATTLEVAIYQALSYDFELARAITLIALQLGVTLGIALVLTKIGSPAVHEPTGSTRHHENVDGLPNAIAIAVILPAAIFVLLPFAAIFLKGVGDDFFAILTSPSTLRAISTSVSLAAMSGIVCVATAWALAQGVAFRSAQRRHVGKPAALELFLATAPSLALIIPPLVLAAGWFIALRLVTDPFAAGPVLLVAINALMALPFATRLIFPAIITHNRNYERLCDQLELTGWVRLWRIDIPALKRPLTAGFAFSMALSLGDVSVIALYGSQDLVTLPSLILQNMGSYRTSQANVLALILCFLTAIIMLIVDRSQQAGRQAI